MAAPPTQIERGRPAAPPAVTQRVRQWGAALGMPIASVLFAFVVGAIVIIVTGGDPVLAYQSLLCGGFGTSCSGSVYPALQLSETIVNTIPLILTGLSVAIAFRGGLFNIGAEGQLIAGVIATTWVGIQFGTLPGFVLLPLVLIAGTLAGALWGGIAGVLKAYTGAHEVVTTIMLNYIALYLLRYLIVAGPMELKGQHSVSASIGAGGQLPTLIPSTAKLFDLPGAVYRAHTGIFIALAAAAFFAFLLKRTSLGYEIRAVGQSQRAARYAGVNVSRTIIVSMLLAGAFAGLSGAVQIAGLRHNLTDSYGPDSTGFDGIAVALLGQNTAIGAVLAAVLFAALHVGGQFMQSNANVSSHLVEILQALILFSIAANFLYSFRLRLPGLRRTRSTAPTIAEQEVVAVAPDRGPPAVAEPDKSGSV